MKQLKYAVLAALILILAACGQVQNEELGILSDVDGSVIDGLTNGVLEVDGCANVPAEAAEVVDLRFLVSGRQVNRAKFEVDTNWVFNAANRNWTGSDPVEFTVPSQDAGTTTYYPPLGEAPLSVKIRNGATVADVIHNNTLEIGARVTETTAPATLSARNAVSITVEFITCAPTKSDPVITWSDPADIYYGTALNTTDHLNATASVDGSFDYAPSAGTVLAVGTHTLKATFTPSNTTLYNVVDKEVTISVLAWTLEGFYRPVNMDENATNNVKGGSTVPLKFEVFKGSTELVDTSIVSAFTQKVNCDASIIGDEINDYATGNTSLRYDTTEGQFIFNWKTPKQPGACYRVTMQTADGSSISANFNLK